MTGISFAQQREQLRQLIALDHSIEVRQRKLDSFFTVETRKMSSKTLADCYHDYAARWYFGTRSRLTGDVSFLDPAIKYTKKAIRIRKGLDSIDYKELKKSIYNVGFFSYTKEDFFGAIEAYSELIEIGDLDVKTAQAHRSIANAYSRIGDFHKASYHLEKAIAFCKQHSQHKKLLLDSYLDTAYKFSFMGYKEFSKEILYNLNKADSMMIGMDWEDSFATAQIRQIQGNRLLETGDYQNAIPVFEESLRQLHPQDSMSLAIVYNSLALAHLKINSVDKGVLYSKKSIAYNKNYSLPHENLGDFYSKKKEFVKALHHHQIAIQKAIGIYQEKDSDPRIRFEDVALTANKLDLLGHFIAKANALVQYYQYNKNEKSLVEALEAFRIADELVDVIRFESTEHQSKLFWREKGAALYMRAVHVCYLLQKPEEAYYFMEKNKALLLLEDLTNERAKENAKLPLSIAKREFELKRKIALAENELLQSNQFSDKRMTALRDKIYNIKKVYEKFIDSLGTVFPTYATTKKKVKVIDYQYFREKYIDSSNLVLHYILNDTRGFGLLTSSTTSFFFKLDSIDALYANIAIHRELLSKPFVKQTDIGEYIQTTNRIFRKLIPENTFEDIKDKTLTIIPDDILQQISFETLSTSEDTLNYLIKDSEIKYAYSISHLDQNRWIKRNPEKEFIGIAPILFKKEGLSDLTLSQREVEAIQQIYGGDILLNEKASKHAFLDTLSNYRILHLSTHAAIGNSENPWIAFTDKDITLQEIYAVKNQSEMVVLSACNTSLGALKKGEGIMSLARGFFYSGAKSVVSSLWSANDKANQELMTDFYKNLSQGLKKSAALRNAKLEYINSHTGTEASPFYWGGLILIGDNDTIPATRGQMLWLIASISCLLLLFFLFLYFKMKKK